MGMRLQNVAGNKALEFTHKRAASFPAVAYRYELVFTWSFCVVAQPIAVRGAQSNSSPSSGCPRCAPTVSSVSPQRRGQFNWAIACITVTDCTAHLPVGSSHALLRPRWVLLLPI